MVIICQLLTTHSSHSYHVVRESVAMQESLTGHVPSVHNPADFFTNIVPGGAKRKQFIGKLLHDLYRK